MKYVIIGAVAAGTTAAAQIKRNEADAQVLIYDKENEVSVSACGIPYLFGDVIDDPDHLYTEPEAFSERYGVDVRAGYEVTVLDSAKKEIKGINANGQPFTDHYDRLLIATGASAPKPPVDGTDLPHVFTIRTMDDAKQLDVFFEKKQPKHAVVVGTGFIGLEMVENLKERGMNVSMLARGARVASHLDEEMGAHLIDYLLENGVDLRLNEGLKAIEEGVVVTEKDRIETDLVILATGVKPNVSLAEDAGLAIGVTGGILVNRKMETSHTDIYAAGDCIEMLHVIDQNPVHVPLGTTANKTGKIAGSQMSGGDMLWKGILGTSIFKLFNWTVASTGFSEEMAKEKGYDIATKTWEKNSRAGYWAKECMWYKAVVDKKTNRLLGVQIIGEEGVDKRIDVAVTVITNTMRGEDIYGLDLSYAPPFNTVNDPIHYVGLWMEELRNE